MDKSGCHFVIMFFIFNRFDKSDTDAGVDIALETETYTRKDK